jgi:hypothetical protein
MIEELVANCPVELVTLAHEFGGKIIETKRGYKITWQHK